MIDNLSDYVIENGVLYKTCPSCQLRCEERVYYKCPEYFGYRGKIIQSQCNKCRGGGRTETKPLEGGKIFKDDILHIKEIRILPMSKDGILPCNTIKEFFCEEMVNRDNIYYYKRNTMNIPKGTLVLFQFQAQLVGYGIYEYSSTNILDKEILDKGYVGYYKFFNDSIVLFETPIPNKILNTELEISLNQSSQKVSLSKFPKLFEMMNLSNSINVIDYIEESDYGLNADEISIKNITVIDKFHIIGIHHTVSKTETDKISSLDDYKKEQERKHNIGNIGEELIFEFEKEKLRKLGLEDLVDKVKRVSLENSHLGYDILSFNENKEEIYIEVKTKSQNINYIDFYLTANEYETLTKNENNFIYYISKVRTHTPKLFILNKDKIDEENLKVVLYKVSLDYKEDEIL